jgi:hypothetical protein
MNIDVVMESFAEKLAEKFGYKFMYLGNDIEVSEESVQFEVILKKDFDSEDTYTGIVHLSVDYFNVSAIDTLEDDVELINNTE